MMARAGRRAAPPFVNRRRHVDARRLQHRCETEHEPGDDRHDDREHQRRRIEGDRAGTGARAGERRKQRQRPERKQ